MGSSPSRGGAIFPSIKFCLFQEQLFILQAHCGCYYCKGKFSSCSLGFNHIITMHKSAKIKSLIPRYNEDSDRIHYKAIHYHVKTSDADCASIDVFIDESSFKLKFSEPCQTTNSPTKKSDIKEPPGNAFICQIANKIMTKIIGTSRNS